MKADLVNGAHALWPGGRGPAGSDRRRVVSRITARTFVIDGRGSLLGIDWDFNGWGGRFPCTNDSNGRRRDPGTGAD